VAAVNMLAACSLPLTCADRMFFFQLVYGVVRVSFPVAIDLERKIVVPISLTGIRPPAFKKGTKQGISKNNSYFGSRGTS